MFEGPLVNHLLLWGLVVISVAIVNHWVLYQRQRKSSAREMSRFRAGLIAELRVLSELYYFNLDLIDQEAGYLLSGRPPLVMCKGNINRFSTLLDESVIGQVVAILARNELIDSILSARAQRHGNMSFRFPPRAGNLQDLKHYYLDGLAAIAAVTTALEQSPPPTMSGVQWVLTWARPAQTRSETAAV
jgi:hypothetical protein